MSQTPNAAGGRTAGPEPRSDVSAELLSVDDVAALLACSARHVYRLADAGRMPRPLKLGKLVRWPRSALMQWITDGCPMVRARGKGASR